MNKQRAKMLVLTSPLLSDEEKKLLLQKIENPLLMCKSTGCYAPRKPAPANPKYPQSRYCIKHAKIAKANAEFMGKTFSK